MRYRWDFRFIFPFGKTDEFNEIPMSERFFLGGVTTVRGYKDFIIGPRFVKGEKDDKGELRLDTAGNVLLHKAYDDPTGGISSSLLSIEYIQEILPILDVFLFMDAGYVSKDVLGFGTYRMSYGIGANIQLMGKMPITIGYGIPVNPEKKSTRNFFFSMGGNF